MSRGAWGSAVILKQELDRHGSGLVAGDRLPALEYVPPGDPLRIARGQAASGALAGSPIRTRRLVGTCGASSSQVEVVGRRGAGGELLVGRHVPLRTGQQGSAETNKAPAEAYLAGALR
jgi:hypothetical protein